MCQGGLRTTLSPRDRYHELLIDRWLESDSAVLNLFAVRQEAELQRLVTPKFNIDFSRNKSLWKKRHLLVSVEACAVREKRLKI